MPATDPVERFKDKFSLPARPGSAPPEIPRDLDGLSDADLMNLYREFMAWVSYSQSELVMAEIDEEKQSHKCRLSESTVLIGQWNSADKADRVTLAKARRDVDPIVVAQQEAYQTARAYRKLVETMFASCERGAQLLSRELSRRIGLGSKDNRITRYTA
jgi:hypothetical protein